ncbi:SAM-dependent methyltransferase [Pelagibius sp. CAU 1746]|uniref:class I SAM-dependent methyltransferase n=1 Tax=Pelagibius sp. CAU 1746 TaxID=3140370 RepID=UPI00325AAA29
MVSLLDHLRRRLEREGMLSVADYMGEALTHPVGGYYMRGDPFGAPGPAGGDFITAPEISQMFGELIGVWCADSWLRLGQPAPCALVELGPGRGTLMADALRATRQVPGFHDALDIHLVEVSPALRERQRESLGAHEITWLDNAGQIPEGPLLLIANEFFDALPVRQFEQTAEGWAERVVVLGPDDALAFALAAPSAANRPLIPAALRDAPEGTLVEVCPAALNIAAFLGHRLARQPGAALIVDYGPASPAPGPTLQALRHHRHHEVLDAPGSADLTAHVDFASLAQAAASAGCLAHGPVPQGDFLGALGIELRAAQLAAAAPRAAEAIGAARKRLTDPAEMGGLFKTLALTSPGPPFDPGAPAGFEAPAPQSPPPLSPDSQDR